MEESVTRKYVHEESGSVTSLCGAVEGCLSQGKMKTYVKQFTFESSIFLVKKTDSQPAANMRCTEGLSFDL